MKWEVKPIEVVQNYLLQQNNHLSSKYAYLHLTSRQVIDLGCGEGKLELGLREKGFTHVTSYDLVKIAPHVVECDIKHLPQKDSSVHAAVFCLSLMGTNYIEFLLEANRVLSNGGLLLIAEVSSRFSSIPIFKAMLQQLGFQLLKHVEFV